MGYSVFTTKPENLRNLKNERQPQTLRCHTPASKATVSDRDNRQSGPASTNFSRSRQWDHPQQKLPVACHCQRVAKQQQPEGRKPRELQQALYPLSAKQKAHAGTVLPTLCSGIGRQFACGSACSGHGRQRRRTRLHGAHAQCSFSVFFINIRINRAT